MKITLTRLLFAALSIICFHGMAQDMEDVEFTVYPANGNVAMLEGRGGNIGVSYGEDGIIIIDDQFAPLSEKILTALRGFGLGDIPLKSLHISQRLARLFE